MSKIFRQNKEYKSDREVENNTNETIEIVEESEDFREETVEEVAENPFSKNESEVEEVVKAPKLTVSNYKGKVIGSTLVKFRKEPSFESEVLKVITLGTEVNIEKTMPTNDFIACSFAGDSGYIAKEYIELTEE